MVKERNSSFVCKACKVKWNHSICLCSVCKNYLYVLSEDIGVLEECIKKIFLGTFSVCFPWKFGFYLFSFYRSISISTKWIVSTALKNHKKCAKILFDLINLEWGVIYFDSETPFQHLDFFHHTSYTYITPSYSKKKFWKRFREIAQILCNATFPRIKVLMAGFYFFFSWTGMVNEIVHKGSNLERKMTMLYLGTEVYSRTREVVRLCEMITYYSMCRYILHSR